MCDEERMMKFLNHPKKYMRRKDNKLYALIGEIPYRLVPWENRFDWKEKGIKPERYNLTEFNKKFKFAE